MIKRRSFPTFLLSRIPTLVGFSILIISLSYLGFDMMYKVKNYEEISFFSVSKGLKHNYSQDLLEKVKNEKVLRVNVYDYEEVGTDFSTIINTSYAKSDFHIIPFSHIKDMEEVMEQFYVPFDQLVFEQIEKDITGYDYLTFANIKYGINLINLPGLKNNYQLDTGQSYYLMINKQSVNINSLTNKGKTNNIIKMLNVLVEWIE